MKKKHKKKAHFQRICTQHSIHRFYKYDFTFIFFIYNYNIILFIFFQIYKKYPDFNLTKMNFAFLLKEKKFFHSNYIIEKTRKLLNKIIKYIIFYFYNDNEKVYINYIKFFLIIL